MAVASTVVAGLSVIDTDVVIPVRVHLALVAVAEGSPVQDRLTGTWKLIHAGASLQGGRATVLVFAVAIVVTVAGLSVGSDLGLAELGWLSSVEKSALVEGLNNSVIALATGEFG